MAGSDQSDGDGNWGGRAAQLFGALVVALLVFVAGYYLLYGAFKGPTPNSDTYGSGYTQGPGSGGSGGAYSSSGAGPCNDPNCQPQSQQTQVLQPLPRQPLPDTVREWRRAAWQRDDIFAQITLGDLYSRDDSFYDPVEAYVWYYMALRDDHAYDTSAAAYPAMQQLFNHAQDREATLFDAMSLDQRLEARRRLIYILANRGADGFITLGRLHRDYYSVNGGSCRSSYDRDYPSSSSDGFWGRLFGGGHHGDRQETCLPPPATAIVLSNPDALMYFDIAEQMGHPLAQAYISDQENLILDLPHGNDIINDARARARTWHTDLEYYDGQSRGGTLHSDESVMTADWHQALLRIGEIPPETIYNALLLENPAKLDPPRDPRAIDIAVRHFQELLQDDVTGVLTPIETVRLIQMGAVAGDARLQTALGVMYTKGEGVPRNYVRAAYWFDKADQQGSGEATYYLGVLYKTGVMGIPRDADKAARLFTEAALRGFDPSRSLLLDMLGPHAGHPDGHDEHLDEHRDEHRLAPRAERRGDEHHPIHRRDHHRRPQ